MMSTSPTMPKCSAVPRPVLPRTPVEWESSTTSTAPYSRQMAAMSGRLAMAPSIEKTPSVITIFDLAVGGGGELGAQVVEVAVLVDAGLALGDGLGEPEAVDDRGVVELVAQDEVVAR